MSSIILNVATFRTLFPAYSNSTTYPDIAIQADLDLAAVYVNDTQGCFCCSSQDMTTAQRTQALYLMAAHLLYIDGLIASGQGTGGIETSATIDKISVTIQAPPDPDQWTWWLNGTPYGQKLAALLDVASAGGFYIGGQFSGIRGRGGFC